MNDLLKYISEETPPKASAMINTFRAFGYNLQTAIADIIDNSISASADNIWINYKWLGSESWVSIVDDGIGMDKDTLVTAMTPGSKDPNDERDLDDLGRFGLGLKTSSFSQCKTLTVASKSNTDSIHKRCWDLDFVNDTGKWSLLDYISNESHLEKIGEIQSGTIVLWENLDRLVGNSHIENEAARKVFLEEFFIVEEHLSLVFHRFIEKNKIKLWINGLLIEATDPFMKDSDASQLICDELLDDDKIHVKCYVLPHISKITMEKRESAKTDRWYSLQGYYIYRNERLLLYGDWLGLFNKNEQYKNARILIDISNQLDHEWKIDIKKATATPSLKVRRDLIRLGKMTRLASGSVFRFRGNQVILDDSNGSFDFQPIWRATKKRDGAHDYFINEEHPIVKKAIEKKTIDTKDFKTILKLIGQATPVEAIIQNYSENPESVELRGEHKELEPGTIQLAKMMYDSLKISGIKRDLAIKQILNIEPFNEFPQLIEYLK